MDTNEEIRLRRRGLRMTQKNLADKVGIHQVRMSAIERGKTRPRSAEKFRIALVLGMRMEDLFGKAKR